MTHSPATEPRRLWVLILVATVLAVVTQACASQSAVPSLEQRAQALDQEIMCPVCPGESIDQSRSEYAKQMRAFVREKLAEGWSDKQIKQYYVERFGPRILMAPPQQGFSLLAWVLPPLGVGAALIAYVVAVRRMRRRSAREDAQMLPQAPLSEEEREEYSRRIEAMLAESNLKSEPESREQIHG